MKYSPALFVAKWVGKFPHNDDFLITEGDLQEFAQDIADSFGVTMATVPPYVAGTTYAVGNLVRYLPAGQPEAFYYALTAGQLSAPGGNTTDWKVVPGPTTATALSQAISLVQAQGIEGDAVVAGREYLIDFGLDANGDTQTVSLVGVSNNSFAKSGTLEINGQRWDVEHVDVFTGTYTLSYSNGQIDGLLATKQGAILEHKNTFIPPGSAGLTRAAFGTYLYAQTVGASVVDLPPPTANDVGTLLAIYNNGGSGGGGSLSWQVQLPPGNPPPGFPVGTGPTVLEVTTPPLYATLFQVIKFQRGFPYSDVVYSYVALANSPSLPQAVRFGQLSGLPSDNPALFAALAGKQNALTTQLVVDFNGVQTKPLYPVDFGKCLPVTTTDPGSVLTLLEPQAADVGKITSLTLAAGPSPVRIDCVQGGATAASTLGSLQTGQTLLLGIVQQVNGLGQPGPLRHVVLARETAGGTSGGSSGAPQWVAGPQTAGALVYDAGYVYRVKQNIANSQSAPGNNTANYLLIGPGGTSSGSSSTVFPGAYEANQAGAQAIPEPGATAFFDVGIRLAGGQVIPLDHGTGYTFVTGQLTILAAAGVKAQDIVTYTYATGSVSGPATGSEEIQVATDSTYRVARFKLTKARTLLDIVTYASMNSTSFKAQVNAYRNGAWSAGATRTSVADVNADVAALVAADYQAGAEVEVEVLPVTTGSAAGLILHLQAGAEVVSFLTANRVARRVGQSVNQALQFGPGAGMATLAPGAGYLDLGGGYEVRLVMAFASGTGRAANYIMGVLRDTDGVDVYSFIDGFIANTVEWYGTGFRASFGPVTDTNYHEYVARHDGTTLTLLLDGTPVYSAAVPLPVSNTSRLYLGQKPPNAASVGKMDNFSIRRGNPLLELLNFDFNGSITDSVNNKVLTLSGDTSFVPGP